MALDGFRYMSVALTLVVLLRSSSTRISSCSFAAAFLHLPQKGGLAGILCALVSLPYLCIIFISRRHGTIILATIQRPNLRFIHVSAANGPRRRMMGRTPFLCIMRSVGYDFGRCLHQCQDDLVHLLRPLSCLHITVCTNPGTCINLLSSNKGTRDIQPPSTACCCRSSVVGIRHQPLHSLA
jgi:hypothetical protein